VALRATLVGFRDAVRAHQEGINRLNVYPVPDGDTGTNMARTLEAVVKEMEGAADDLGATCDAISHGSLMGARGNSGVILSQVLRGMSASLKAAASGDATSLAVALEAASAAAYTAVLKPIEGTILTVVRETAAAARAGADRGDDVVAMLRGAREAGRDALERTPEMLPVLAEAGVVDAGGAGFLLFVDAALHVLAGEPIPEPSTTPGPSAEVLASVAQRHGAEGVVDVSELRYEVMFLLHLADESKTAFMESWGRVGDSIVVVGGDGLYNCHIHTNDIGAAIEAPLELGGRPFTIRVTDLFEEVADEHAAREAAMTGGSRAVAHLPAVACAVVAVCSGDGLAELFSNLQVQGIVTGGQTMNPSTAELLDAVEHMNSPQVILLPNNKNIVPVANQVDALSTKHVVVVPTCSMPEALAALVAYDPESDADTNARAMAAALATVTTGEVTQAVRDTNTDAGPVREGDWIGLVRGDGVVAVADTPAGAASALLDRLLGDGGELVTMITGSDAAPSDTQAILDHVASAHRRVEVEVHSGGQPLYPFLFGVE